MTDQADLAVIEMRAPCSVCESTKGTVETRNGQDVVSCAFCGKYQYCRPKTESGREVRTVRTRPNIKPSKKARVLERDNARCIFCHRSDIPLHAGHLISVADGHRLGMTDDELYSDENLAAMCDECNIGLGSVTVNPRLILQAIRARKPE